METSQSICTANQLTGFYMRAAVALNGLIHSIFKDNFQVQCILRSLSHFWPILLWTLTWFSPYTGNYDAEKTVFWHILRTEISSINVKKLDRKWMEDAHRLKEELVRIGFSLSHFSRIKTELVKVLC